MLANVKPKNKKQYMENLTAAGFEFSTKENSKIVTVSIETDERFEQLFEVEDN